MSGYTKAMIPERADTQQHIANVTEALLKEMPIEAISVKTIIEASKTSRTTFYRYFMDKFDVITWIYTSEVDQIVAENNSFSTVTLRIFHFMYARREFFISALSYEQQNSLVEYMAERSMEDCIRTVKDALQTEELPRYMEASIDFFVAGCIRTWQGWASRGMRDTPEFILSVIIDNMPQILRPYFK